MKIAGRKNQGAWFRANKVISTLNNTESGALAALFEADEKVTQVWQVIDDLRENAGIAEGTAGYAASASAMCEKYADLGIPLQVWMGRLSYDTYTRTGAPGAYEYEADHQSIMHEGGVAIRKIMKRFVFSRRAALDLSNTAGRLNGNPGGIANAAIDIEG